MPGPLPGLDTDAILKQLLAGNRAIRKGPEITFYESAMGFYHAVRWTEPWVAGLLCAHLLYACVLFLSRRNANLQLCLLFCTCGLVYAAQPLNGYLHAHWRQLGFTQDYFDPRGVFMSCLYSTPLLLMAFAQMVGFCPRSGPMPPLPPPRTRSLHPANSFFFFYNSSLHCGCPAHC